MGLTMIREMSAHDLDKIVALEQEHQSHPWPLAGFEQALRLRQRCLVFEEEDTIVGYAICNKGHGRNIYAGSVKAADALYAAWFAHAQESAAPELWAQIEPTNRAARIRLRHFGFESIGCVPSMYGPGIDAEVWRKRTQQNTAEGALESA